MREECDWSLMLNCCSSLYDDSCTGWFLDKTLSAVSGQYLSGRLECDELGM